MSGPFVTDTQFPITVKYVEKTSKSGLPVLLILKDKAKEKEFEARYKDDVKSINTMWVQPNWKQSNDLIRQATKFIYEIGERKLDWQAYKTLLLETFMVEWDVKADGKTVPCIKENIERLDANIASFLIDSFLLKTSPSEEELGNL